MRPALLVSPSASLLVGLPLARSPSSFCSLSTVMSPAEVGIVYVPVCTVAVVLESKS